LSAGKGEEEGEQTTQRRTKCLWQGEREGDNCFLRKKEKHKKGRKKKKHFSRTIAMGKKGKKVVSVGILLTWGEGRDLEGGGNLLNTLSLDSHSEKKGEKKRTFALDERGKPGRT